MLGGNDGRTVPTAEGRQTIRKVPLDNLVAFAANDVLGPVPEDSLSPAVPEDNILLQIYGVSSIGSVFQPLQETLWHGRHLVCPFGASTAAF